MRIVVFGSYRLWEQPRVRVLIDGLRAHNLEVIECNVPLAFDTSSRVAAVRRPWRGAGLGLRIAQVWPRLWRKARSLPRPDAVLVPYLGHFDVHLARRLWPRVPLVLDQFLFLADTAADRGMRSRALLGALDRIDRAAVRAADLVVVDTEAHRGLLPEPQRSRALVVPVGAPREWFHEPSDHAHPPVRVIFFGIFTPLQGTPVIATALRELDPDPSAVHFTIVGKGQDYAEARRIAGDLRAVEWIDWVERDRLPALVAEQDVCLGIFSGNPKGMRVTPNKVYQGAAAGCAIVTSDSGPQRAALGAGAVYVQPDNPAALAKALAELVSNPDRITELRHAAHQRAVEAFTPEAVVTPLVAALEERASTSRPASRQ